MSYDNVRSPELVITDPDGLHGFCTESSLLAGSLGALLLMEQGMSYDEALARVTVLEIPGANGSGHVTLAYTADDGTTHVIDVFRRDPECYNDYNSIDDFLSMEQAAAEGYMDINLNNIAFYDWSGGVYDYAGNLIRQD